ncbi:hypothetical protein ACU8KH_00423 [Lachancea thermotolerans]
METLAKEFETLSTNDPDSPQYLMTSFHTNVSLCNLALLHTNDLITI